MVNFSPSPQTNAQSQSAALKAPPILVDPAISRAKFDREVTEYRQREEEHQRRGWWMLKAEFPEVFVVFVAPRIYPVTAIFGARIDFSNYDLWAPSVRLAHPLTRELYKFKELPTRLFRSAGEPQMVDVPGAGQIPVRPHPQPLMMATDGEEIPFVCLPGIREYHDSPMHSGDLWLTHRNRGEGKLYFLIEKLSRYGAEFLDAPQFQFQFMGFQQNEVPS